MNTYNKGNTGMLAITLKGNNFKILDMDKGCNIDISNQKDYISLQGNEIKQANISIKDKKINCIGNKDKYNFRITCSTDTYLHKENSEKGLIEFSGTTCGQLTTDMQGNELVAQSNNLSNVTSGSYINNTLLKEQAVGNKNVKKVVVAYQKNISKCSINKIKATTYNGKVKKPSIIVKYGNTKLVKNKDYTLSYYNNKKAGKGKIVVKGINIYMGSKNAYFTIKKAKPVLKFSKSSVTIKKKNKKTYINKLKKKTDGKIVYSSSNKRIATVNSKGKVKLKKKGTVKIFAKSIKGKNYYNRTIHYKLKIR